MSLAASFHLIGELLPLCSSSSPSNDEEDLIQLVYERMTDFVDGETNDECACAILHLLGKARSSLYNSSKSKEILFLSFFFNFFRMINLQRRVNANIGD